jgi:hypothetical protein
MLRQSLLWRSGFAPVSVVNWWLLALVVIEGDPEPFECRLPQSHALLVIPVHIRQAALVDDFG